MPYDMKSIEGRVASPAVPAAASPGAGPPPPLEAAWLKIVEHPTLREMCKGGDGTGIFPVHENGNGARSGRRKPNGKANGSAVNGTPADRPPR